MELCVKLTDLRKKCGLSQNEAATRIGVSRQTISKWESGAVKPDMKNLSLIAEVYGISTEDLLNENYDMAAYIAPEIKPVAAPECACGCECGVEEAEIVEDTAEEVMEAACDCCDTEDCADCDEDCTEADRENAADKAKIVYNKVKTGVKNGFSTAKTGISAATKAATEKISTIEVPKSAIVASCATVACGSAVLAALLKNKNAKIAASVVSGAAFLTGAAVIIKDLCDCKKACKADQELDDLDIISENTECEAFDGVDEICDCCCDDDE